MKARLVFAATFAASLSPASLAWAHARLEHAVPGVGATVAAPSAIDLTFSEGVVPAFSGVALTDEADRPIATGKPSGQGAALSVPVSTRLKPGTYTVRWHAVSVDTHKTQGSFRFTVAP